MDSLQNKIAVVTGGNSGIGYATAKVFKEMGATVIITGRRKEALEKAGGELGVHVFVADQAKVSDSEKLAQYVKENFGKTDILFINAGVLNMEPILQVSEEDFDYVTGVNYKGAYFVLQKFIPNLNEGGSVIFLSSNTASMSRPNSSVYSASKAALNSVMKTAALELAPQKIRVNSISPGPTESEIIAKAVNNENTLTAIKTALPDMVPLKMIGKAENVGKMAAYLSTSASDFITGADFIIDGGMVLS